VRPVWNVFQKLSRTEQRREGAVAYLWGRYTNPVSSLVKICTLWYRVQEYRLPAPISIKCNVLRESLSEDSQNIPCATLKRRGTYTIHVGTLDTVWTRLFSESKG
jgi:hypothetical protein